MKGVNLVSCQIVVTRPAEQAADFASALIAAHGGPLPLLIAPLMEIAPVHPAAPVGAPDHLIFTSANGVAQAVRLGLPRHATAWCVGDRTAKAALAAGFNARSAAGNSDALIDLIRSTRPVGRLLHLHGEAVAGTIVAALRAAGFDADGLVVYTQAPVAPVPALLKALQGADDLVIPLFSPRSARLLLDLGPIMAPLTLVAISAATAEAAIGPPHRRIVTAKKPDQFQMIAATLSAARALGITKTP